MITPADATRWIQDAHSGQLDKAGEPYWLHPLAVASRLLAAGHKGDTIIVALLHDVIEDTDLCLHDLRDRGVSERAIEAIDAISRRPEETYAAYTDRVCDNNMARIVKIADVQHNLSPERRYEGDESLRSRYAKTLNKLRA